MSWHDPKPPVADYWPTLALLFLTLALATAAVYLLLA